MSRRILIAGNWKMNKTSAEGAALVKEIAAGLPAGNLPEILVGPPYLTIPAVVAAAKVYFLGQFGKLNQRSKTGGN